MLEIGMPLSAWGSGSRVAMHPAAPVHHRWIAAGLAGCAAVRPTAGMRQQGLTGLMHALKHYKLEGFSVERLMAFLTALGSDIEIRVHLSKRSSSPGRILVNAA